MWLDDRVFLIGPEMKRVIRMKRAQGSLGKRERRFCTTYANKIRGCLLGGAIGYALGYPVEFMSYQRIKRLYGSGGIETYELDRLQNVAHVLDDTQMSLFTANGILFGETRMAATGEDPIYPMCIRPIWTGNARSPSTQPRQTTMSAGSMGSLSSMGIARLARPVRLP